MGHYVSLFITSVFIENMALAFFLGMCTFWQYLKSINGNWFRCCSNCRHGNLCAIEQLIVSILIKRRCLGMGRLS